jgi:hypothetical protein
MRSGGAKIEKKMIFQKKGLLLTEWVIGRHRNYRWFFWGGSSLGRLCMPDRVIVFQSLSCILKKHYFIRRLEGACSTAAFASEPPGAGERQKHGSLPTSRRDAPRKKEAHDSASFAVLFAAALFLAGCGKSLFAVLASEAKQSRF